MPTPDRTLFPGWEAMERVESLDATAFDGLPFGAIALDPDGVVLRYNMTESRISNRKPEQVIGKNFFTQVAPCTNVQEFAGRFREGVAKRSLDVTFPYHFDFQMDPVDVYVRLFYSQNTQMAWVFVTVRDRD